MEDDDATDKTTGREYIKSICIYVYVQEEVIGYLSQKVIIFCLLLAMSFDVKYQFVLISKII